MHKMHNFLGIRCNIWERATKRTLLTHRLASGGQHNVGNVAVPWESILHGKCGSMGRTKYESVLHAESHASLDIPALPEDRSQMNVHGMLKLFQSLFVLVFVQTCIIAINCIINVNCVICIISDQKSPGYIWADQLCSIWRPSEAVLIPSHWAPTISRGTARAMLAICVPKTEKDQSPGLGFYTTSWSTFLPLSAENGQSVVL